MKARDKTTGETVDAHARFGIRLGLGPVTVPERYDLL